MDEWGEIRSGFGGGEEKKKEEEEAKKKRQSAKPDRDWEKKKKNKRRSQEETKKEKERKKDDGGIWSVRAPIPSVSVQTQTEDVNGCRKQETTSPSTSPSQTECRCIFRWPQSQEAVFGATAFCKQKTLGRCQCELSPVPSQSLFDECALSDEIENRPTLHFLKKLRILLGEIYKELEIRDYRKQLYSLRQKSRIDGIELKRQLDEKKKIVKGDKKKKKEKAEKATKEVKNKKEKEPRQNKKDKDGKSQKINKNKKQMEEKGGKKKTISKKGKKEKGFLSDNDAKVDGKRRQHRKNGTSDHSNGPIYLSELKSLATSLNFNPEQLEDEIFYDFEVNLHNGTNREEKEEEDVSQQGKTSRFVTPSLVEGEEENQRVEEVSANDGEVGENHQLNKFLSYRRRSRSNSFNSSTTTTANNSSDSPFPSIWDN